MLFYILQIQCVSPTLDLQLFSTTEYLVTQESKCDYKWICSIIFISRLVAWCTHIMPFRYSCHIVFHTGLISHRVITLHFLYILQSTVDIQISRHWELCPHKHYFMTILAQSMYIVCVHVCMDQYISKGEILF